MKHKTLKLTMLIIILLSAAIFSYKTMSAPSADKCGKFCSLSILSDSIFREMCDNSCSLGCCTDLQGFKHNSYSKFLCDDQGGQFSSDSCDISNLCEQQDLALRLTLDDK